VHGHVFLVQIGGRGAAALRFCGVIMPRRNKSIRMAIAVASGGIDRILVVIAIDFARVNSGFYTYWLDL